MRIKLIFAGLVDSWNDVVIFDYIAFSGEDAEKITEDMEMMATFYEGGDNAHVEVYIEDELVWDIDFHDMQYLNTRDDGLWLTLGIDFVEVLEG